MDFATLCQKRKSCRSFSDTPVSEEELQTILRAAVAAPSACNMQSWYFYVLHSAESREKLTGLCAEWIKNAPAVIVVCTNGREIIDRFGDRARDLFILQDTALASENIMLQAADLGLGSCFIGAFNEDGVREVLSIPADKRPVGLIPIGHSTDETPKRARTPLEEKYAIL